jgi:hypothetical protein
VRVVERPAAAVPVAETLEWVDVRVVAVDVRVAVAAVRNLLPRVPLLLVLLRRRRRSSRRSYAVKRPAASAFKSRKRVRAPGGRPIISLK